MGAYISVDFAKLSTVSAQATALGRKMDTTKDELIALQLQLRETQNYLEKRYDTCWDSVVPIKRLRKQSEKMDSVVSVLSTTDTLAKGVENKLRARANMLKLFVSTTSFMFSTAMSVIAGNLTGETDCGNGWCWVGNGNTKKYVNSKKNWSPEYEGEANDYSDYTVVKGFSEDYVLNQHNYYKGSVACTATSDAIVASIVTGKLHEPNKDYWTGGSCNWPNTDTIPNTKNITVQEQCQIICENIEQGNPVILRVPNHSVVAVGMKQGVDPANAQPSDILIIDPGDGKVKTADEIYAGWYNNTEKLSMKDSIGWSLRVAE